MRLSSLASRELSRQCLAQVGQGPVILPQPTIERRAAKNQHGRRATFFGLRISSQGCVGLSYFGCADSGQERYLCAFWRDFLRLAQDLNRVTRFVVVQKEFRKTYPIIQMLFSCCATRGST